jgi:hypothetical protein
LLLEIQCPWCSKHPCCGGDISAVSGITAIACDLAIKGSMLLLLTLLLLMFLLPFFPVVPEYYGILAVTFVPAFAVVHVIAGAF